MGLARSLFRFVVRGDATGVSGTRKLTVYKAVQAILLIGAGVLIALATRLPGTLFFPVVLAIGCVGAALLLVRLAHVNVHVAIRDRALKQASKGMRRP